MDSPNQTYINLQPVPIVIEEVDSIDITDAELSEFVVADNIVLDTGDPEPGTSSVAQSSQKEEILIKQLMGGELTFNEYKVQMGQKDEIIEEYLEEEVNNVEEIVSNKIIKKEPIVTKHPKRNKRSILPPALQGLMGEANLCYARGNAQLAEKVCLEIVRQMPLAAEPFLTLAQIYESTDSEKCLQFLLIAAHLNPTDHELWIKISEMSTENGNMKQAINALTRAIKAYPKNIDVHLHRIEMLQSIGEEKFAFMCRFVMLSHIPKEQGKIRKFKFCTT